MTSALPPNLLRLFAPRPPLRYLPPTDKAFKDRRHPVYTGISAFLEFVQEEPDFVPTDTLGEQREKRSYETNERRLRRELEKFGPIKSIVLVTNKISNKPRGYAFVEYVNEDDVKVAYKEAGGLKIDGSKIFVDVERGRTVKDWLPRSLGGGLGEKRNGAASYYERQSQQPRRSSGLGFRQEGARRPIASGGYRGDRDRTDRDRGDRERVDRDRGDRDRGDRDLNSRAGDRGDSRNERRTSERSDTDKGGISTSHRSALPTESGQRSSVHPDRASRNSERSSRDDRSERPRATEFRTSDYRSSRGGNRSRSPQRERR